VENIAETAGNVEVWSSTENTVKQNEVEVEQSHTDIILTHFICSVYSREREGFSSNCPLATRSVQWVPLSGPAYHNQQKILIFVPCVIQKILHTQQHTAVCYAGAD